MLRCALRKKAQKQRATKSRLAVQARNNAVVENRAAEEARAIELLQDVRANCSHCDAWRQCPATGETEHDSRKIAVQVAAILGNPVEDCR
jgi:hypothetical protein